MISWDSPYLLYAAPVVAGLFAALAFWARRVRISRAGLWSPALKEKAGRSGLVSVFVLSMCALASTIALAGPRWGQRTVVTENKALTVVLAVDVSRSMLAEDESPSRLGKVKREVTRLVQDLRGDRIGLIGFAGRSYILSPLTVDDGAIQLLVDGLDPEMASAGGTELSVALKQGRELLLAGPGIADRVLIVFSDGESHDSLDQVVEEASKIRREGIRLILAGVGNVDPVPIPIRDGSGNLIGFHEDQDGREVRTRREDQVLSTAADAAMGALVSARLNDQAGAIRDLVNAYQRSPEATTSSDQSVLRTWVFLLLAASLLALQTVTRRTSALIVVAGLLAVPRGGISQQSKNPADDAWRSGDYQAALSLYER
ncbi:MAG: VWA domain-containing protein, partial [Gemmatimonadota bacterium]|nr:VWA domain-containing protein [Gemmatimonadota bacterium]